MAKRAFDILVSILLLAVLSPVLLAIAIAIWIDDPGSALFRQQRVGRFGNLFTMYKFRSMKAGSEGLGLTYKDDPRVTRIGKFLRRYKLDELPQLLNVIRGEMSLVGPRPELAEYVTYYPIEAREIVLSMRPGITELASIRFRNENDLLSASDNPEQAYIEEILPEKVKYYLQYADSSSFRLDLWILFYTLYSVALSVKGE